jgi:hypothetical protein
MASKLQPRGCNQLKVVLEAVHFIKLKVCSKTAQRPRDGSALLLAAGELRWIVFYTVRHLNFFECFFNTLLAVGRRYSPVDQWKLNILVDRYLPDKIKRLKDETDLAVSDARSLPHRNVFHGLAL